MSDFKELIGIVATGASLSREQAEKAFSIMMSGDATPSQIGGFLMALRVRGETVDEVTGAVLTMRAKMLKVKAPDGTVDIVGTGGTQTGTYSISTCSAFVMAGAGVVVAKHGNRALSSKAGTADTLEALGVNLNIGIRATEKCINDAGIGFLFAPNHHTAVRFVGPTRVELGTRTIFNILGPLANPASAKRQVIGAYAAELLEPMAQVMKNLGSEHAWFVHGGGMDEITVTGPTQVVELKNGAITSFEITPEDVGLSRHDMAALKGGDSQHNAAALLGVLNGDQNAYRDIVLLNAGAGILVSGQVSSLAEGVAKAAASIDQGAAKQALNRLIETSNG